MIRAVGSDRVGLSPALRSHVLPPPIEAFREFLIMIRGAGFEGTTIQIMAATAPTAPFSRGPGR